MLSNTVWLFSGIDFLYDAFDPLTPQGKRVKRTHRFITDEEELAGQYDLTEAATSLARRRKTEMDRVEFHLKHITDITGIHESAKMGTADVFVVKKFLLNYKAVVLLLDRQGQRAFDLEFALDDLLARLDVEDSGSESFYISDRYRAELREVRRKLRTADFKLKQLRGEMHNELLSDCGLNFRFREFLIVPNSLAASLSRDKVFVEPHDNTSVLVRPVMSEECLQQYALREKLALEEQKIEQAVLADLAVDIVGRLGELRDCARKIAQFDISLARARLSKRFGLVRPSVSAYGTVAVRAGRLLPLEQKCKEASRRYWPTDMRMETAHGVIHGSNMCGKTVVLRTLAFCQIAAQLGFFVPAERFDTVLFDGVFFIGPSPILPTEGLSSFGMEIVDMSRALESGGKRKLLLVDEFARTTNSKEAVALISGLLEWLADQRGPRILLATHYRPLPRMKRVTYYVMKGLRWDRFEDRYADQLAADPRTTLADRVSNIQECIEYKLLLDTEAIQAYDALHVAAALGLNRDIVDRAVEYAVRDDGSEESEI